MAPAEQAKVQVPLPWPTNIRLTAIIDDGLLIVKGKKVAGKSAKYERTTVQAVKRAIFFSKEHAEEVKQELHCHDIKRLLILRHLKEDGKQNSSRISPTSY